MNASVIFAVVGLALVVAIGLILFLIPSTEEKNIRNAQETSVSSASERLTELAEYEEQKQKVVFTVTPFAESTMQERVLGPLPLVRGTVLQHYDLDFTPDPGPTVRAWIGAFDIHDVAVYNGGLFRWVMYDPVQTNEWFVSKEYNAGEPNPNRGRHKLFAPKISAETKQGYPIITNFEHSQAGFVTRMFVIPVYEKDIAIVASHIMPLGATTTNKFDMKYIATTLEQQMIAMLKTIEFE